MPGSTTTMQAYTEALMASLGDTSLHPTLSGVSIVDGPPSGSVIQLGEFIMFGDVNGTQSWAAIDSVNRPKNEVYTIDCWIDCVGNQFHDQKTLNDRAIALLAEIEKELRSNIQQGIFAVLWAGITSEGLQKRSGDTWREAWIPCQVEVHARI